MPINKRVRIKKFKTFYEISTDNSKEIAMRNYLNRVCLRLNLKQFSCETSKKISFFIFFSDPRCIITSKRQQISAIINELTTFIPDIFTYRTLYKINKCL